MRFSAICLLVGLACAEKLWWVGRRRAAASISVHQDSMASIAEELAFDSGAEDFDDMEEAISDMSADAIAFFNAKEQLPASVAALAAGGHLDPVRDWLSRGGNASLLLALAVMSDDFELAEESLQRGASPGYRFGSTLSPALNIAVRHGNVQLVELLLNHSADVNAQGGGPLKTALMDALLSSNQKLVRLLIEHSADVNADSGAGYSPLRIACASPLTPKEKRGLLPDSRSPLIQLLDAGADVEYGAIGSTSALDLCVKQGLAERVAVLVAAGSALPPLSSCYQRFSVAQCAFQRAILNHTSDVQRISTTYALSREPDMVALLRDERLTIADKARRLIRAEREVTAQVATTLQKIRNVVEFARAVGGAVAAGAFVVESHRARLFKWMVASDVQPPSLASTRRSALCVLVIAIAWNHLGWIPYVSILLVTVLSPLAYDFLEEKDFRRRRAQHRREDKKADAAARRAAAEAKEAQRVQAARDEATQELAAASRQARRDEQTQRDREKAQARRDEQAKAQLEKAARELEKAAVRAEVAAREEAERETKARERERRQQAERERLAEKEAQRRLEAAEREEQRRKEEAKQAEERRRMGEAEEEARAVARAEQEAKLSKNDARAIAEASADPRYKTIMCRNFTDHGSCRMGVRCHFAHGAAELRVRPNHSPAARSTDETHRQREAARQAEELARAVALARRLDEEELEAAALEAAVRLSMAEAEAEEVAREQAFRAEAACEEQQLHEIEAALREAAEAAEAAEATEQQEQQAQQAEQPRWQDALAGKGHGRAGGRGGAGRGGRGKPRSVKEPAASSATGPSRNDGDNEDDEDDTCAICFSEQRTHVFVPCGHKCICEACGEKVMKQDQLCPMCRKPATQVMKIFG